MSYFQAGEKMYHILFTWVYQKAWGSYEQQRAYFLISAINIYLNYTDAHIPYHFKENTQQILRYKWRRQQHIIWELFYKNTCYNPCKPTSFSMYKPPNQKTKGMQFCVFPTEMSIHYSLFLLTFLLPHWTVCFQTDLQSLNCQQPRVMEES